MSHKLATLNGIKGGNWLTILSDPFVERLGGRDAIREALGEPFAVESFTGGVMIVAGNAPEVGDRNRNIDAPLYRKLARILRPIRIDQHPPVYAMGPLSVEGEFDAWLARFDR
jgi:hypothetical protein